MRSLSEESVFETISSISAKTYLDSGHIVNFLKIEVDFMAFVSEVSVIVPW